MRHAPLVLLVDDDANLSEVAEAILKGAGYAVAKSADGREGLAAVHSLAPDVIVSDVMMPQMDGLLFLAALPRDHVPVVVMSGFDVFEPEARTLGAAAFLRKPFLAKDLLSVIASVRDGPRVATAS